MPTLLDPLIEAALIVAPELLDVPVLGRILSTFRPTPGGETKVIEQMQASFDKKNEVRVKTQRESAQHVIKVSDALKCVEQNASSAQALVGVASAVIKNLTNPNATTGSDIIYDKVAECFRQKTLTQKNPRVAEPPKQRYHRPAKGHGKGRSHF